MIAAILFDCDGVLVDSEVLAEEVGLRLLADIGLDYDPREFGTRFRGVSTAAFWEAVEADGWARLGRSITGELRQPLEEQMRVAFRERLAEVPGARNAVATVRHPKAVASSSRAEGLRMKLEMVARRR